MSFTIHQATRCPYNGGKPRKPSKHGAARRGKHQLEWDRWMAMLTRCYSKTTGNYARYGGRGITVCDKWRKCFADFFVDVGPCPSKDHTLDRIDNSGNYEPGNVKWSTRSEQQNNRRGNRLIKYGRRTLTITQWARECGINARTLHHRIKMKWPIGEALSTPATFRNRKHYV